MACGRAASGDAAPGDAGPVWRPGPGWRSLAACARPGTSGRALAATRTGRPHGAVRAAARAPRPAGAAVRPAVAATVGRGAAPVAAAEAAHHGRHRHRRDRRVGHARRHRVPTGRGHPGGVVPAARAGRRRRGPGGGARRPRPATAVPPRIRHHRPRGPHRPPGRRRPRRHPGQPRRTGPGRHGPGSGDARRHRQHHALPVDPRPGRVHVRGRARPRRDGTRGALVLRAAGLPGLGRHDAPGAPHLHRCRAADLRRDRRHRHRGTRRRTRGGRPRRVVRPTGVPAGRLPLAGRTPQPRRTDRAHRDRARLRRRGRRGGLV